MHNVDEIAPRRIALHGLVNQIFGIEGRQGRGHPVQPEEIGLYMKLALVRPFDGRQIRFRKRQRQRGPYAQALAQRVLVAQVLTQQTHRLEKTVLGRLLLQILQQPCANSSRC